MGQAVARHHQAGHAPANDHAAIRKMDVMRRTPGLFRKVNAPSKAIFFNHITQRKSGLEQAAHRSVDKVRWAGHAH